MTTLVLYTTCLVLGSLLLGTEAQDVCSYFPASRAYARCFRNEVGEDYFTLDPMSILTTVCSGRDSITNCVQTFARDCTNGKVIRDEASAYLGMCDANNVAPWVQASIPSDAASEQCRVTMMRGELVRALGSCVRGNQNIVGSMETSTMDEGFAHAQSIKNSTLGCLKEHLRGSTGCPGVSWKKIYNKFLAFAMSRPPLLGIHMVPSDFLGRQDAVQESRELRMLRSELSWLLGDN